MADFMNNYKYRKTSFRATANGRLFCIRDASRPRRCLEHVDIGAVAPLVFKTKKLADRYVAECGIPHYVADNCRDDLFRDGDTVWRVTER